MKIDRHKRGRMLVLMILGCLLFLQFWLNPFGTAARDWFWGFERGTESLVVGRLVKSRQDGLMSAGGLTGVGSLQTEPLDQPSTKAMLKVVSTETIELQYAAYERGLEFQAYTPYTSQPGGQAFVLSLADRLIPFALSQRLQAYKGLQAFLLAVVLTMFGLWIAREAGMPAAAVMMISAAASPWLLVFGRNLWWSLWVFFVPMLVVASYFRHRPLTDGFRIGSFGVAVASAMLLKCAFTGFEFITTAVFMAMVPIVYHSVRHHVGLRSFLRASMVALIGSALAVGLTVGVLSAQIAAVEGDIRAPVEHIASALKRRSHSSPESLSEDPGFLMYPRGYTEALAAPVHRVVWTYVKGTFLDANRWLTVSNSFVAYKVLNIRYAHVILLFAAASAILLLLRDTGRIQADKALVVSTWFAILAPVSWFVIFKAHSYVHTHMNFVVWHLPFALFGFALTGRTAEAIGHRVLKKPGTR